MGSGFRVQGSGFRVQGSEHREQGSGYRVQWEAVGGGYRGTSLIRNTHPPRITLGS